MCRMTSVGETHPPRAPPPSAHRELVLHGPARVGGGGRCLGAREDIAWEARARLRLLDNDFVVPAIAKDGSCAFVQKLEIQM